MTKTKTKNAEAAVRLLAQKQQNATQNNTTKKQAPEQPKQAKQSGKKQAQPQPKKTSSATATSTAKVAVSQPAKLNSNTQASMTAKTSPKTTKNIAKDTGLKTSTISGMARVTKQAELIFETACLDAEGSVSSGNFSSTAATIVEDEAFEPIDFDFQDENVRLQQRALFGSGDGSQDNSPRLEGETQTVPLLSSDVLAVGSRMFGPGIFPNFGLLAEPVESQGREDPRIFLNTNSPWSAFICGSQGSGKSHSLACMLENCLLPETPNGRPPLGQMSTRLSGLVFHYDPLSTKADGIPCEAASLTSMGIKVQVLCSLTNLHNVRAMYHRLDHRIEVKPLLFKSEHLDVKTMMSLMAADDEVTANRLYMHTVRQELRTQHLLSEGRGINFDAFRRACDANITDRTQQCMLQLRFQLIENFIKDCRPPSVLHGKPRAMPHEWTAKPGQLTIVDLSCPFVDPDTACNMFDISLGIFQKTNSGRAGDDEPQIGGKVIALDEAHKFMTRSAAALKLTESLKTSVRMQRHYGLRVIVATQEPTIATSLLDLCSITLIHRFSSPDWYTALRSHLAAVAVNGKRAAAADGTSEDEAESLFVKIAQLNAGEAFLCAPTAMLEVEDRDGQSVPKKMGIQALKVIIRQRYSNDAGASVLANRRKNVANVRPGF